MQDKHSLPAEYLNNTGRDDLLSGGVKMIPIETSKGTFRVWTKRIGNHPTKKVLLLHGGPGSTHEYLEAFDSYFPPAGIEYYYYDQLGSYYSDQPDEPELRELDRFVDEVEQVRLALKLSQDNFYLFGTSWGGILAIEYALKYQQHLKALIISNMGPSIPKINTYRQKVLLPNIDPDVLAEIRAYEAAEDYENPRYMGLVMQHHFVYHFLRMPVEEWPDPVLRAFKHANPNISIPMFGRAALELGGKLADWDRTADLVNIKVSCLVIGAEYDFVDPKHLDWIAGRMKNGRYFHCPNGSHSPLYDDQKVYFQGLVEFIQDVDAGRF